MVEAADRTPKQRILAACDDLFTRQGTRPVGVDTIIERAGVAKATLYSNFGSKDALVVAWLRSPVTRWLDALAQEMNARTDDPVAALVTVFDVLRGWFEEGRMDGCPFLHTMSEYRDRGHPARVEVDAYVDEVLTWLRSWTEAAGVATPGQVAAHIRLLVAGAFDMSFATSSSAPWGEARAAAVALLAAGLGTSTAAVEQRVAAGASGDRPPSP